MDNQTPFAPQNGIASASTRLLLLADSGELDESESYLRFLGELISTLCLYSLSGPIDCLKTSEGRFDAVFS